MDAYLNEHGQRHAAWYGSLIVAYRPRFVPVQHIPLAPFDSPTSWRCCSDGTCDGKHDFVQRRDGSKDDRISADKTYLAQIHGRWFMGTFGEQWYGWNFNNWGMTGIQLDLIEDLYEIDLEEL